MKANPWILSCFIGSHISISCFHNFSKNSNGHVLISTLAEDEFLRFLFNWLTVISVSHLSNSFSDLLSRLKIKFIKKIILLPLAFFFFAFFIFIFIIGFFLYNTLYLGYAPFVFFHGFLKEFICILFVFQL